MESTREQKGLTSTPHYDLMIDNNQERTAYEIWSEGFGQRELVITVHMPHRYLGHTVDPYLNYETTNIQNSDLALAFAETFKLASDQFAAVDAAFEAERA